MIDRWRGLWSHARTVARGVESKPQPHAMTLADSATPAGRAGRAKPLVPLGETCA